MSPGIFDPNFSPITLLVIALANPFVIGVAFLMGRQADQSQKLIIAGMAAALAGAAAAWLITFVGLLPPRPFGADAGLFMFSFIYGTLIAAIGYATSGRKRNSS